MSTYSIYPGTTTEAIKLNTLQDSLVGLIDNTSKLITPKDVRNAVYTTWENIALKTTIISGSTVSYTGYDLSTLRQKFYFGKKKFLNFNIMTNTLLNSNTDVFIYNNKADTDPNQNTKISILAGTSSVNYVNAPYIEAVQVAFPPAIDLHIMNTASFAKIAIDAPYVNIKGINYPSSASASTGQFLKYNGAGSAVWGTPTITSILNPGNTVSIVGSPVLINGYPMDYTNSFPSQITVGGATVGTTFSHVAFVEMFNMILYPYLLPTISITMSTTFYERGMTFAPTLYYSYQAKTGAIFSATLSSSAALVAPGLVSLPTIPFMSTTYSNNSSLTMSAAITDSATFSDWYLKVCDGTYSVTATASSTQIYPFFYGMTNSNSLSGSVLYSSLTKDITTGKSNKSCVYTGNNDYMYFAYPSSYGTLSQILDQNGFMVYDNNVGSFTYSINTVTSNILSTNWSTSFYIYKTNLVTTNYGYQFQFIF